MGLYRRGKIYWFTTMQDGKRIQVSTKTDSKRLAEAIYAKAKTEVIEGRWFENVRSKNKYTFKELAEKYHDWCKGRQRAYGVKKYIIDKFLKMKMISELRLDEFSNLHIEQLQTDAINSKYQIAYINKITAVLSHMFTKAVDWGMMSESTLKRVRKAKPLKGENRRLRYLSTEECQALINACDNHLRPIVVTALNTGMRKSEILNLTWDNLDLRHGFILLDRTKNGDRREVPINKTLRTTLQGIARRLDVPYVFYNPITGKPYTKNLKRSFQTALKKAGIRDFKFHDLRHTFASQLIMANIDLTTVKELLGHRDIKMTLRYSHLAPSHKVKAVEIYDQKVNCYNFATVAHESKMQAV